MVAVCALHTSNKGVEVLMRHLHEEKQWDTHLHHLGSKQVSLMSCSDVEAERLSSPVFSSPLGMMNFV